MYAEIVVRGADRTSSRFHQLQARLAEPRPALEQAADYWREREAKRFATRGGGRWEPDMPETVKRKGHARVGVDSGRLMASLTRKGAPGSVSRISGATLRFGTSDYRARFFAKRRPLFNVTATDRRQVAGRIARWLMEPFE